ncbi:VOC family protein [Streptomyces coelicoflavus]|uniref:VOC family protein n=1 Tax=Streptomyces coelicoflavus TaxID=285562 RepID=A0A7K3PM08_9ACTN|nr:VOC family protein [Streptomyces coelicoflavus]NEB10982.1 VOC family protein [Streptomyces coelicoflavus]
MAVRLNHTILTARDRDATTHFLVTILGLDEPRHYGPFLVLQLSNDVSLDVLEADGEEEIKPQHYAFLVDEAEFDEIFTRVRERGLPYWADPFHSRPGRTNTWYGGRGVYFDDPNGHSLEIMTQPYETD